VKFNAVWARSSEYKLMSEWVEAYEWAGQRWSSPPVYTTVLTYYPKDAGTRKSTRGTWERAALLPWGVFVVSRSQYVPTPLSWAKARYSVSEPSGKEHRDELSHDKMRAIESDTIPVHTHRDKSNHCESFRKRKPHFWARTGSRDMKARAVAPPREDCARRG